ncbi:MAG: hypothetical protein L0H79_14685 [Intrasporangium sp.]|uniref:hypothetical protein n=1 Tax=Intrasporangium sp. TaxID=1925024 RepID=UPI0026489CE8|nr:hypothetical protein [Intrasporangium sp.]MDN5796989.1 hypothetical protein [Intrasporangium sp.]
MDAVKTYRYLRIAMIGMVVMLGASVLHEWWATGWQCLQPSVSAYYYTPARGVVVGSLVAVGVCLVVVRGSTDWEDILLNLGGAVAPVIAFVPTPEPGGCRSVPMEVTDIPANVANNVFALLVLGLAGIIVTIVIARSAGQPDRLGPAGWFGLAATVVLYLVAAIAFFAARSFFLEHAHYAAAFVLFICMVAVVIINAWSYGRQQSQGSSPRPSDYANAYAAVAVAMVGTLVLMLAWRAIFGWDHAVLWIEGVLIACFAAFWTLQTRELWGAGLRASVR